MGLTSLLPQFQSGLLTAGAAILFALGLCSLQVGGLEILRRRWPPVSPPDWMLVVFYLMPSLALLIWIGLAVPYVSSEVAQDFREFKERAGGVEGGDQHDADDRIKNDPAPSQPDQGSKAEDP